MWLHCLEYHLWSIRCHHICPLCLSILISTQQLLKTKYVLFYEAKQLHHSQFHKVCSISNQSILPRLGHEHKCLIQWIANSIVGAPISPLAYQHSSITTKTFETAPPTPSSRRVHHITNVWSSYPWFCELKRPLIRLFNLTKINMKTVWMFTPPFKTRVR